MSSSFSTTFFLVSLDIWIISYSEFDTLWVEDPLESAENALHDEHGTRLYENDTRGLLFSIIYLNDVPRLKQYLSVYFPRLDIEDEIYIMTRSVSPRRRDAVMFMSPGKTILLARYRGKKAP